MYGAILGDIIGSPYEFGRGDKTKDFPLFSKESHFTDDTVMTVAVGQALMETGPEAPVDEIESAVIKQMQAWGKKYPDGGYGSRFIGWLSSPHPQPYDSWGNGSAMRVSAAGWLYDTLERTCEVAKATAVVSHNHPEGVKGAQATAAAIYMARNGASKQEIKEHIGKTYGYDLDRTLDQIRPTYHHVESCQETVPEAIISFLEADSFEDAIRGAVSLGGDADTLGAIAGSIAEAYYGIPENLIEEARKRLTPDILKVLDDFYAMAPKRIPAAGKDAAPAAEPKDAGSARDQILAYAREGRKVYVPYDAGLDQAHVAEVGRQVMSGRGTPEQKAEVHLLVDLVAEDDRPGLLIPVFTTKEQLERWPDQRMVTQLGLDDVLELALRVEGGRGVVVNPMSDDVCIELDAIPDIIGENRVKKATENPIPSPLEEEPNDIVIQGDNVEPPRPLGMADLDRALQAAAEHSDEKTVQEAADALQACLKNGADVLISYYATFDQSELDDIVAAGLIRTSPAPLTLPFVIEPNLVTASDGQGDWLAVFTNWKELEQSEISDMVARIPLLRAMQLAAHSPNIAGLLINPFGYYMSLPKPVLTDMIRAYASTNN